MFDVRIGEERLVVVNTIEDAIRAQSVIWEKFMELVNSQKRAWEQELLSHTNFTSMDELVDFLDEASDFEAVKEKAIEEALQYSDFDTIEEVLERVEELNEAIENIYDCASDVRHY